MGPKRSADRGHLASSKSPESCPVTVKRTKCSLRVLSFKAPSCSLGLLYCAQDYIAIKEKHAVFLPHTAGRYAKKRFRKAQVNGRELTVSE